MTKKRNRRHALYGMKPLVRRVHIPTQRTFTYLESRVAQNSRLLWSTIFPGICSQWLIGKPEGTRSPPACTSRCSTAAGAGTAQGGHLEVATLGELQNSESDMGLTFFTRIWSMKHGPYPPYKDQKHGPYLLSKNLKHGPASLVFMVQNRFATDVSELLN